MQKKRILFLCRGNSCRSQIAEGFLRKIAGDRYEAFSAGVKPTQVSPLAIKVMKEAGVDISKQWSKSVKEFIGQQFDYVVTLCSNAKQECPIFPGRYERAHWNLDDPAEADGSEEDKGIVFRKIRDQIRDYLTSFVNAPGI